MLAEQDFAILIEAIHSCRYMPPGGGKGEIPNVSAKHLIGKLLHARTAAAFLCLFSFLNLDVVIMSALSAVLRERVSARDELLLFF